jgi:hypothetical protein
LQEYSQGDKEMLKMILSPQNFNWCDFMNLLLLMFSFLPANALILYMYYTVFIPYVYLVSEANKYHIIS